MLHPKKVIIAFVLLCKYMATQAQSHEVKVYTNGYKGWITTSSASQFFFLHKDTTLLIAPDREGYYYLNTGATIGSCSSLQTSYIYLYFDKSGLIDSICPSLSADKKDSKTGISLNTTSVTIDTGRFNREWIPSWEANSGLRSFYRRKKTMQLIKGQTYAINTNYAGVGLYANCQCDTLKPGRLLSDCYYGSYFYFTVLNDGHVKLYESNAASGKAYGRKLRFKTTMVTIDPAEISQGNTLYLLQASTTISIAKKTRFPFIRAISNHVYWSAPTGKKHSFYFLPM